MLELADRKPTREEIILSRRRAEQQARDEREAVQSQGLRDLVASAPEYQSALDFEEFGKFKDFAYGTEDSPYARMLKERSELATSEGLDTAAAEGAGQLSNVYSQLAMSGGLQSGGRERLAGQSAYQTMLEKQKGRRAGRQEIMGIDTQQADQRMGAQEKYLEAMAQDKATKGQYEMDRWKQKTDLEAGILKSQAEKDIAASNSCILEGTLVQMTDGSTKPIEMIRVGDVLPSGTVYCVQSAMAPSEMWSYFGNLVTESHAVPDESGWVRAKDSRFTNKVTRPAHTTLTYNLGVTGHFIMLASGHVVGDLHETDKHDELNFDQSLEAMNETIPVRAIC